MNRALSETTRFLAIACGTAALLVAVSGSLSRAAIITTAITTKDLRLLGLASASVVPVDAVGSAVVGPVGRLTPSSVLCGRMLVSISVEGPSPTRAAPSTRQ